MSETQSSPYYDWLNIALVFVCVLLIACNIALMKKYQGERKARQDLIEEKQAREELMLGQAFQEQATMQMEFRFLRHAVEEAVGHLQNQECEKLVQCLPEEFDYSSDRLSIAYYLRGLGHAALNHEEEAIRDFSTYLDIVGVSSHARFERARLYHKQGKVTEAIEDLNEALYHRPDFTPAKALLEEIETKRVPDSASGNSR